jgi:hypothetical protein
MECGVAIREFSQDSYAAALDRLELLKGTAATRRDLAQRAFDVRGGIETYDRIYRNRSA